MDFQEEYQNPLISIPQKKIDVVIRKLIDSFPADRGKNISDGLSDDCCSMIDAVYRYAKSNIPVDYWFRSMDNFRGDKTLLKYYNDITHDIKSAYFNGTKLCFAGSHGIGKTLVCSCILKTVVEKGYSGLYATLTDVVSVFTSGNIEARSHARDILLKVDFLVIDEFDPRFMGSDNAADLYGRILEQTLRSRVQNTLPLLLCTNSPNVVSSFSGSIKQSIGSLMSLVKMVPVLGQDIRPILAAENK